MTRRQTGSALVAALLALLLGGAVAAAVAEIGRLTVARVRLQQHAAQAWFLAEAGLAEAVAAIEAGRSFTAALAAAPREATDGPWRHVARLLDDRDDSPDDPARDVNERILVRVEAAGPPPVRRRLEAVVTREDAPFLPGAATLAGSVRELTRDFRLNGRDFHMAAGCSATGPGPARAGLALPEGMAIPPLAPGQVLGRVRRTIVPDLRPLADEAAASRHAAGPLAGPLGDPTTPRFTVVDGDAVIDAPRAGTGLLYVAGRLSVRRSLDFTGVLAAGGGIDVGASATLTVCGAVWAGGHPALAVRGTGMVRHSTAAITMAGRLAPLPARPEIVATRELFGGNDG